MNDSGEGCLLVIVLAAVALFYFGLPPYNKVDVYYSVCAESPRSAKEAERGYYKFRVSSDGRGVVVKTETGYVGALTNCQAYNRKNWRCDEFVMIDGDLKLGNPADPHGRDAGLQFVNKAVWLIESVMY